MFTKNYIFWRICCYLNICSLLILVDISCVRNNFLLEINEIVFISGNRQAIWFSWFRQNVAIHKKYKNHSDLQRFCISIYLSIDIQYLSRNKSFYNNPSDTGSRTLKLIRLLHVFQFTKNNHTPVCQDNCGCCVS